MYLLRQLFGVLCLLSISSAVHAQNLVFQNLDENSFKQVVGDLSTNFLHTSVSGAGPLGHIFGFEVGLVGGQTNTPHISDLAHQVDPAAKADKVYDAALLGVITVPFGLTGEVSLLPKVGSADFKFNSFSAAVKWTPTEIFGDLPLSLAAKASYSKTALSFNETVNNGPVNYSYDSGVTALTFLVSKNFAILEPYFGLGLVNAKGDLSATGSNTVFLPSFSTSNSASSTRSGTMWLLGTEVKLLVVKLGVEYTHLFETSRVMGKLSFFF